MRTLILSFTFIYSLITIGQDLKSPSTYLGYKLGTRFTRHHKVVDYYRYVAATLPNQVVLQEYGETNEGRPLLLAYLSNAINMANLENIRTEHIKNTVGEGTASKAIVWLSYNVHGNESVSTEASMQTLYDLLSVKKEYLDNTVVIIDPCMNPDGRDRYVNWYNQYINSPNNVDPNSKEHHEPWQSGRANHYMFDLNRDWAWLTQIESQQRLKFFNQWLPHVHVDFHEQGVDNPYYFTPAAEPFHEVVTDFQRDFQKTIGKNHAKYFDANGWFYFKKEVFDLLYPSYGDTYPTYNGGIGMTYEQGGSGRAGLGIIRRIGDTLTLKDRIAHHLTTGLSTVEVAALNAKKLNTEFRKFYEDKNYNYKSYVLNGDADKILALTKLLDQHEIKYGSGNKVTLKGYDYATGTTGSMQSSQKSLVVTTEQVKGTLVKVLFEPRAKLSDSVTYDITAWSLPYAYGLQALASSTAVKEKEFTPQSKIFKTLDKDAFAFLTDWDSMNDARFLAHLMQRNIKVRYTMKPFTMNGRKFERGTLIMTEADNSINGDFIDILKEASQKYEKELTGTTSNFLANGKNFEGSAFKIIPDIKVAVLTGKPTSTLQFGEIWHFFEQQLHYPVTIIDSDYMNTIDFDEYDVFVLPGGGGYKSFMNESRFEDFEKWVFNGGKLIAMGEAINGLIGSDKFGIKRKESPKDNAIRAKNYKETERDQIKETITGAIFKTKVDITHPLAFGYNDSYFSLKLGAEAYDYLDTGSIVYLEEKNSKPISGFAGSEAQKKIANTLVFGVEGHGSGSIIYMVDNPLFRGFWENGKLFFANALFLVN